MSAQKKLLTFAAVDRENMMQVGDRGVGWQVRKENSLRLHGPLLLQGFVFGPQQEHSVPDNLLHNSYRVGMPGDAY